MIPLFSELRPHLEAMRAEAEPGTEYLISRYRSVRQNLSTQFERIVCRAGIEPWPKLFQNLRSTRETELMETYPAHVVCAWIGNSEAVAQKHYLQVTDDHFAKAVRSAGETAPLSVPSAPLLDEAVQKAVQQMSEPARKVWKRGAPAQQKARFFRGLRHNSILCKNPKYLRGFERLGPNSRDLPKNPLKNVVFGRGGFFLGTNEFGPNW